MLVIAGSRLQSWYGVVEGVRANAVLVRVGFRVVMVVVVRVDLAVVVGFK